VLKLRTDVGVVALRLEMAPQVFAWVSDPEVAGHLGLRSEPSLAKTEAWLARATSDDSLRGFAILLDGRHVGNVVLDLVDRQLLTARLSVYVGEAAARGAGVGTTAVYHCLHEAFENLGLAKVWLVVHVHNAPAIVAYTRLGFQVEGVLREEFVLDGERVSALRMGILRREFRRLAERAAPTP
jgi:RimJ/RimL family protein N-acetyltransferase